MSSAIASILSAIATSNQVFLQKMLQALPLTRLPLQSSNDFLVQFINSAIYYNNPDAIELIIKAWEDSTPNDDQYSITIFHQLFYFPTISDQGLAYLIRTFPEHSAMTIFLELAKGDGSNENAVALHRAGRLIGSQPLDVYQAGIREAQIKENARAEEVFRTMLTEVATPVQKPSWILGDPTESNSQLIANLPPVPVKAVPVSDDELIYLLTAGLNDLGVSFEDAEASRIALMEVIPGMTNTQKRQILDPILTAEARGALDTDQPYFSVLGPVNARVGADLSSNHRCSKYGGCRMLLCNCYELNSPFAFEEDEEVSNLDPDRDWFAGSCRQCDRPIAYRWYALRQPMANGGWVGTYCSESCILEAQTEPNRLLNVSLDKIMVDLDTHGIQDRLPESNSISGSISGEAGQLSTSG